MPEIESPVAGQDEVRELIARTWGLSVAALFFVMRDGIGVIRDYQTLHQFEPLIPIAERLGVNSAALAQLRDSAERATTFD
jgi:hypothetical protein